MSVARPELPVLEVGCRADLRTWLEANAAPSPGVRLAIGKKGNAVTQLTYDDAVGEALNFGWIDSVAGRLDDERFTVRFTPRKPGGGWARTNKVRVEDLIVPADLVAALAENPAAERFWNGLRESARKIALYRIASAKRPETRAKRIAETVADAAQRRLGVAR